MTLAEAVLRVLLGFRAFAAEPQPETELERQVRLTQAAIVMTDVAVSRPGKLEPMRAAAVLLTQGKAESNFARYVGEGQCMSGPAGAQCDPHHGKPRARGYWQPHRSACPRVWNHKPGSYAESREAAECIARLWAGAVWRCRNRAETPEAGGFAGLRGIDCTWRGGVRRARALTQTESRLRQLLAQPARPAESRLRVRAEDRVAWLPPSPPRSSAVRLPVRLTLGAPLPYWPR